LKNIVGIASDGANIVVRNKNSFYTLPKSDVPSVILMNYICHSAVIIARNACEQLPRSTEELLRGVASYIYQAVPKGVLNYVSYKIILVQKEKKFEVRQHKMAFYVSVCF